MEKTGDAEKQKKKIEQNKKKEERIKKQEEKKKNMDIALKRNQALLDEMSKFAKKAKKSHTANNTSDVETDEDLDVESKNKHVDNDLEIDLEIPDYLAVDDCGDDLLIQQASQILSDPRQPQLQKDYPKTGIKCPRKQFFTSTSCPHCREKEREIVSLKKELQELKGEVQ